MNTCIFAHTITNRDRDAMRIVKLSQVNKVIFNDSTVAHRQQQLQQQRNRLTQSMDSIGVMFETHEKNEQKIKRRLMSPTTATAQADDVTQNNEIITRRARNENVKRQRMWDRMNCAQINFFCCCRVCRGVSRVVVVVDKKKNVQISWRRNSSEAFAIAYLFIINVKLCVYARARHVTAVAALCDWNRYVGTFPYRRIDFNTKCVAQMSTDLK